MANNLGELLNIGSQVEGRVGGAGGSPEPAGQGEPPIRAVGLETETPD